MLTCHKVFHVESVVLGPGEESGRAVSVGEVDSGDEDHQAVWG